MSIYNMVNDVVYREIESIMIQYGKEKSLFPAMYPNFQGTRLVKQLLSHFKKIKPENNWFNEVQNYFARLNLTMFEINIRKEILKNKHDAGFNSQVHSHVFSLNKALYTE